MFANKSSSSIKFLSISHLSCSRVQKESVPGGDWLHAVKKRLSMRERIDEGLFKHKGGTLIHKCYKVFVDKNMKSYTNR